MKSTSTVSLTSAASTESQSVCVNTAITSITYDIGGGATGASVASPTSLLVDGLPSGITSNFSAGVLTIEGTPTVPPLTETTYTYTINTSGNSGSCSETTVSGTITVAPAQVITLVSDSALTTQDVCNPSLAITDIIYDISGSAYQISPTAWNDLGLPDGINANQTKVAQVNTINVTGAATGTHSVAINGEIFTFGDGSSSTANAIRNGLKALINASGSVAVIATDGAGAGQLVLTAKVPGTPFAVNLGGYSGATNLINTSTTSNTNRYTIEGTLAAGVSAGTYTYTLTTYAGASPTCTATSSLQGSITLKASSTLALTSAGSTANQTVCNNTAITSITYTIGGSGTGAQIPAATMVVDGLPNGVTGTYSSTVKKYIIKGTPNVTVPYTTVFNYTVTTVGPSGCDEVYLSGSITVEPEEDIILVSAGALTNQTLCAGEAITDIIYDIKGSSLTISPTLEATV